MSGYEIPLFVMGLVVGAAVTLLVLRWLRRLLLGGSVTITDVTCQSATQINIQGTVTPTGSNVCIRLYSFVYTDVTTTAGTTPPPGATTTDPPAGTSFVIQQAVPGGLTGPALAVVWAAFGTYANSSMQFGPCGSGSGSGTGGLLADDSVISQPAPRHYRLVIEEPTPGAVEAGLPPDVHSALSRRDVTLAYDELLTTPREATWTEAGAAEDAMRWRLTLRKMNGVLVAALELAGDPRAAGPRLTWQSRQWHFFGRSRFAAPGDSPGAWRLPGLGVEPA
jgi:hypothetical protein